MKLISKATEPEIEDHLKALGAGNYADNMKQVTSAPDYCLVELSDQDFLDLVFLSNDHVRRIVPHGSDRRLKSVAQRAIDLPIAEWLMHENWDIASIQQKTTAFLRSKSGILPKLLLRDPRGSERDWAPTGWYLQDGSHRALGYCMAILQGKAEYIPQQAYCVTDLRKREL